MGMEDKIGSQKWPEMSPEYKAKIQVCATFEDFTELILENPKELGVENTEEMVREMRVMYDDLHGPNRVEAMKDVALTLGQEVLAPKVVEEKLRELLGISK